MPVPTRSWRLQPGPSAHAGSVAAVEPRRLADSLSSVGRQLGLAPPAQLDAVVEVWPAVAARLAPVCTPVSMRDGELTVLVDDPGLIEAISWHSADWCRRLNDDIEELGLRRVVARSRSAGRASEW